MLKQSFTTTHQVLNICTTNRGETLEQLLHEDAFSNTTPVFAKQVHAAAVIVVQNTITEPLPAVDGMITRNPNLTLIIRHADCLPIIFWHETGVFGALHAGRKSTELGIVKNALELIDTQFGISSDVSFWFGPAICKPCYQINRDLDLHYDLTGENRQQISEWFSDRSYRITESGICTDYQNDKYYSYRGDGPGTKMNYTACTLSASPNIS